MGSPEQHLAPGLGEQSRIEAIDPHHFYAAYVFDDAATRRRDVAALLHEAQRLSYPVRYWWLSEAMDLQDAPDRLVVCVHHPSSAEDAGMDLYTALSKIAQKHKVAWDELEAAQVDEYRQLGKAVADPGNIFEPDGTSVFPEPEIESEDLLYTLTREDVQFVADALLGRTLSDDEMTAVAGRVPGNLDWIEAVERAIRDCQAARQVGSAAEGYEQGSDRSD